MLCIDVVINPWLIFSYSISEIYSSSNTLLQDFLYTDIACLSNTISLTELMANSLTSLIVF